MVVAEILTGIALVKQSVDFIKSNIDTVKDIGEIGDTIENLFVGEEQCQKARAKKSGMGAGDQLGIKSVAQEVIDAKLAQEKGDLVQEKVALSGQVARLQEMLRASEDRLSSLTTLKEKLEEKKNET